MADETGEVAAVVPPAEQSETKVQERKADKMGWFLAAKERALRLMFRKRGEKALGIAAEEAEERVKVDDTAGATVVMENFKKEHDEEEAEADRQEDPLAA